MRERDESIAAIKEAVRLIRKSYPDVLISLNQVVDAVHLSVDEIAECMGDGSKNTPNPLTPTTPHNTHKKISRLISESTR